MSMKKFIFLILIGVFSCTDLADNRPPDDLIPPEKMSQVMLDIILMKNIKRESSYIPEKKNLLVAEYLYEKHGIDSAQLASSQFYYAKNPKKYIPIFKEVQAQLQKINDTIGDGLQLLE